METNMTMFCCDEPFLEFVSCDGGETWYYCNNCHERVFQFQDGCGG
jgi:hypothetical protein